MLERVGKYEIKGSLGLGGFGQVFSALDPAMGRMVAIKMLTAGTEPDVLSRFSNEAAAAGRLRHKNIVTVYDFCEQDGVPYIVMELLQGEDLHTVIGKSRPLSVFERTRIILETANGLNHAHLNGIVHRDVKPANIMLLLDGSVKIMDFGIALLTRSTGSRLTPQGSVMGTFRYMAPEQFYGQASDVLTDIFSVGVIGYELLTGEHPFHSHEVASLMRNIMLQDPAPLRSLNPECPEALEAVLGKLLSKDREQRYQTLDDARFDLEPVLMELGKARTKELLAEAKKRAAADQLEAALVLIREILELETTNREAREMRESLQQQRQQKGLHTRVDALVGSGRQELAARRYPAAIDNFEAAARLDRTNPELQKLIAEARALMEAGLTSLRLLGDARKEVDRHEFAAARETLSEALRCDPENKDAAELLNFVEKELARLERERLVENAIDQAGKFVAAHAYDDAMAALASLGEDANTPQVARVRDLIQRQKAESERLERLNAGIAASEQMLRAHRFEEALTGLESLSAEFPEADRVSELQLFARTELARHRRAQEIRAIVAKAEELVAAEDFLGALRVIEAAAQSYPEDAGIERLRAGTLSAKADWERRQAIQTTLRNCGHLGSQARFSEAIEEAEAALREHGSEPQLVEAIRQLEIAWAQQRREEGVQKALDEADAWLEQAYPEKAVPVLRGALTQYPGEARLLELASRAEDERRRAVNSVSREAARHCETLAFHDALDVLEQGLARFPEEGKLAQQVEALKKAAAAWRRSRTIQEIVAQAGALARSDRHADALQLLAACRREHRDDAALREAQQRIEQAWREAAWREAVMKAATDAQRLMEQGHFDLAVQLLREANANYPKDQGLADLLRTALQEMQSRQRAADVARAQGDAEVLAMLQDYDGAIHVVKLMLQKWPSDPTLLAAIDGIQAEMARWRRD